MWASEGARSGAILLVTGLGGREGVGGCGFTSSLRTSLETRKKYRMHHNNDLTYRGSRRRGNNKYKGHPLSLPYKDTQIPLYSINRK